MPRKTNKKEFLKTPKGTRDIMPHDFLIWRAVEGKASEVADSYGFKPLRTPHIEHTELFEPTLGETSDIVSKQMYSFKTRGGDNLVLRPEWTVPAVRAYFEHGMHSWPQPVMLYTSGSFFRHENPQKGRFREFGQFDLEILGDEAPFSDALVIRTLSIIFQEIGFKNFVVHINTLGDKDCKGDYKKELVAYYRRKVNSLCSACKRRLKENPLRLLDCKEPGCVELRQEAPKMIDFVCQACRTHFKGVLELLDELEIPYFLSPHLVRGLDYYSRTIFEIFVDAKTAKETKKEKKEEAIPTPVENGTGTPTAGRDAEEGEEKKEEKGVSAPIAIASGGRYDYLAENLGEKHLFGVGGAIGIDRLIEELKIAGAKIVKDKKPDVAVIQLGPQAKKKSLVIFEALRKGHLTIAQSFTKDSLRQQLSLADKAGATLALIIGQKEALEGAAIVRDMASGAQETIKQEKVVDYVKKKLRTIN